MGKSHNQQFTILVISIFIIIFGVQSLQCNNGIISNENNDVFEEGDPFYVDGDGDSPSVPRPSLMNTIVYLSGINQSHTIRGQNFTIYGYTQKFPGPINANNIPVYPIIDGHKYDGTEIGYDNLTIRTSNNGTHDGQFEISFKVPADYVYSVNMIINVNVTQITAESIYVDQYTVMTSPISHDITTKSNLVVSTNIVNPVLTNDTYYLSYELKDSTGGGIQIAENLTIFRNLNRNNINNTLTPVTNAQGQGFVLYYQENGLTALGVDFLGKGNKTGWDGSYYEVEPVFNSTPILRINWINISFTITNLVDEDETEYVYSNKSLRVDGQIRANGLTAGSGVPVQNRQIRLFLDNATLTTISTDGTGFFTYTFNLQIFGYYETDTSFTLKVLLLGYDTSIPTGNLTFIDLTIVQVINQPPPAPIVVEPTPPEDTGDAPTQNWVAILIPIAIVAGLVVGIVLFQRKRMDMINRRDALLRAVDKSGKMWIIMNLYNARRRREAIAYTYKIYTDLFNEKYSVKRENAQTLREYAILTVTKYGQDPLHVYPYVSIIENVIYGAMEVDYAAFDRALTLFGRVFEDLTGTLLNLSLMRNPDTEFDEITIEVVDSAPAAKSSLGGSTPPSP